MFVADDGQGGIGAQTIQEITPSGSDTQFAAGLDGPYGLAFDQNGNLYEADAFSGHIYEFSPSGARSTIASGLSGPNFIAFAVPEPSSINILVVVGLSLAGFVGISRIGRQCRSTSPSSASKR